MEFDAAVMAAYDTAARLQVRSVWFSGGARLGAD